VHYERYTENVVLLPALFLIVIEMVAFPTIFNRIIKIDVLLDDKATEDLLNDRSFDMPMRGHKKSGNLGVESTPILNEDTD
jgi:hypothetical protein